MSAYNPKPDCPGDIFNPVGKASVSVRASSVSFDLLPNDTSLIGTVENGAVIDKDQTLLGFRDAYFDVATTPNSIRSLTWSGPPTLIDQIIITGTEGTPVVPQYAGHTYDWLYKAAPSIAVFTSAGYKATDQSFWVENFPPTIFDYAGSPYPFWNDPVTNTLDFRCWLYVEPGDEIYFEITSKNYNRTNHPDLYFQGGISTQLISNCTPILDNEVVQVFEGQMLPSVGNVNVVADIPDQTVRPALSAVAYGNGDPGPDVSFGPFFVGQSISNDPATDCPNASVDGCLLGIPTAPLTHDPNGFDVYSDNGVFATASGPDAAIWGGTLSVLFSTDQHAVLVKSGEMHRKFGTALRAYDRAGNLLGQVVNQAYGGKEVFGLAMVDGSARIACVTHSYVGEEPANAPVFDVWFARHSDLQYIGCQASSCNTYNPKPDCPGGIFNPTKCP